jgi:hypothetical protein
MDLIADRLVQLGMTHWLPVLHKWLRQYRGLEQFIDCDEDWPENLVLECLDGFLAQERRPENDEELGNALSRLDFLTWRVRHEDGERWKPLEQRLDSFIDAGTAYSWQWDTERPEPQETQAWFVEQLNAVQTSAHRN